MKRYARMYRVFFKQFLKVLMQSKLNFWLGFLAFFLRQIFGIVFIWLVFSQIPHLSGWGYYEIIFIYGFSQIPRGLDHIFTDNLWHLAGDFIVDGSYDRYLLRPVNPLFHMCAENIQPDGVGELVAGVILTVYAGMALGLHFTPLKIVLLPVAVLLAAVVYTSIKLLFASVAFWAKDSMVLLNIAYNFSDFSKYPVQIFTPAIRFVVSYVIPFAFTAFFPAAYFLGRYGFTASILPQAIVAAVLWIIAYGLFTVGNNAYESTGN